MSKNAEDLVKLTDAQLERERIRATKAVDDTRAWCKAVTTEYACRERERTITARNAGKTDDQIASEIADLQSEQVRRTPSQG